MFLKALKPTWRKLIVALGIYFMALMSMGADKAIRDASREHLAKSAEVQHYLAEVKRLYGDAETDEKVKGLTVQLLENASYTDAKGNLELKVSVIKWAHGISMGILCYLLACVACTGAQARKS